MKLILAACLAASSLAQAQPSSRYLPLPTQIVRALDEGSVLREGYTRVRLSLTLNSDAAAEPVRIAGVALCSEALCYEGSAASVVSVSNTAEGTSREIAVLEVPYSSIKSVRFRFASAGDILYGTVGLSETLKLKSDFNGANMVVVIRRRMNGSMDTTYEPVAAAFNYLQPEGNYIYYNPRFSTTAKLPLGVSLNIPAGALDAPQVFVAGVHDTGNDYPLVDISPVVKFSKPAKIELSPLPAKAQRADGTPTLKAVPPGGIATSEFTSPPSRPSAIRVAFESSSSGVIRPPRVSGEGHEAPTVLNVNADSCNTAGWCNCADQLAYPPNQQTIFNGLSKTGSEYLDWCTTIPPYVHIGVSNLADSRERFTVRHGNKIMPPSSVQAALPLFRITTWSPNTQIMVNGFTWDGLDGTAAGQYGRADGHVHDFSFALGDNLSGGGACVDINSTIPCNQFSSGGNKRVMEVPVTGTTFNWFDNSNAGVLSNSLSYVSSSTSIVKNGVCTTDTLSSRWSAVGTTSSGRMIFLSSTSDGTTSAAALCPVFQAMGVSNAIRLDGGPSAIMTIDGVVKNPLTGTYYLKYGSMRYIPYALKVSYPGW